MALARLVIRFDGEANGLTEKRLSLSGFSEALVELLKAYRRTASNLLVSAGGETSSSTGRLHRQAELLDLEIETITGNSVQPAFVATQAPLGMQQALIPDLALRSLDKLLQDVDAEAHGRPQSKVVRAYLAKLPTDVRAQSYSLHYGDRVVRTVSFGSATLADLPAELPRLLRGTGQVVGVGFSPGKPYVEVATAQRLKPVSCQCSMDTVEAALSLRSKTIEFLAVGEEQGFRMLWIRDASDAFEPVAPLERLLRIHADWGVTLAALAQ